MKKLTMIKTICSASILSAALFGQTAFAAQKITFEDFAQMDYEGRFKVCAEHVATPDIARCAGLTPKPSAWAKASDTAKEAAMVACAKQENTTSPQALTTCATKIINGPKMAISYTDAAFHSALKKCAKDKTLTSTDAVMQCTYAILLK